MKKLVAFALLVAAPAMAGFDDDEYHLVKITDRAKEVTYEVMDAEQLEELEAAIKLEKKFHTKAMMLASKEWRKNEELKRKAYPRGAIAARKVQKIGTYKDMDRAEDKKMYYEDKAADKAEADAERKKERNKLKYGGDKSKAARAAAKVREKEYLYDEARQFYEDALEELMAPDEEDDEEEDDEDE